MGKKGIFTEWILRELEERCVEYTVSLPYWSESDILGPNGNLSEIKNLVSFEREMFEDFSYIYRIKNPFIYVIIAALKYIPKTS